jgi:hypothetical protein
MGTMRDPKWYSAEHRDAWERVKAAFRRDWEQTKADFSDKKGLELNQDVGDTVKQAAGKEPVPPLSQPNRDEDWAKIEDGIRYGYSARQQYATDHTDWDARLENKLQQEWSDLKSGQSWDEMRGFVRRGWDRANPGSRPH